MEVVLPCRELLLETAIIPDKVNPERLGGCWFFSARVDGGASNDWL
jgi:hypothetical protein